MIVLVVGLLITLGSWRAVTVVTSNEEHRLLRVQSAQAADILSSAISSIQTPLESTLTTEVATGGSPAQFASFTAHEVGPGHTFVYAALIVDGRVTLTAGGHPLLPPSSAANQTLQTAAIDRGFAVTGLFPGDLTGYGYAVGQPAGPTGAPSYVLYAERMIPADRESTAEHDPAFSDLRYATYFGDTTSSAELSTTDVSPSSLPLRGYTVRRTIPLADTYLTFVSAARGELGGHLDEDLGTIFLVGGVLLSLVSAAIAEQLLRRRRQAEQAGARVEELYRQLDERFDAQRAVAEALQRALLPEREPEIPGLSSASRYVAGTTGVNVGGDWYLLAQVDPDRFAFVVGDVSGRGVEAAAIMARLRFMLLAYLLEGHGPDAALAMCGRHIDIETDGHFATALVGVGRISSGQVVLANAGHLEPLLIRAGRSRLVGTSVGPPLGTVTGATYPTTEMTMEVGDELLLYTDGLVERRDEPIGDGLSRLQAAADAAAAVAGTSGASGLENRVGSVLAQMTAGESEDDTAILALAWTG